MRNLANDVPDEAVTTLIDVVRENRGLFSAILPSQGPSGWALDKLRRYDIYAPAGRVGAPGGLYQDAVAMVLETFADFDPLLCGPRPRESSGSDTSTARIVVARRAARSAPRYCPSQTPWVLINYTGRVRDVATLAHELGTPSTA